MVEHARARRAAAILSLLVLPTLGGCYPKGWRGAEPLYLATNQTPFDIGPYVLKMGPGRGAIVVEHDLDVPPTVDWWLMGDDDELVEPPESNHAMASLVDGLWVAVVDGVPEDRAIGYVVRSAIGETPPRRFRVGRPNGARFRFAALGDTRNGHRVHRALMENLARERVDFVINSGDLVETGGYKDQWDLFWQIEQPVVSQAPLFAAVGNHDNSQRNLFRRWFLLEEWAQGNRYYKQDWGHVRVICLDSEIEMRPGSAQHRFLEETLKDAASKNMLIVISFHYPPYSSGAHGPNRDLQVIFAKLGPKYGIELILNGHDHNYERTHPQHGVTFIVAASGGAPIRRLKPNQWSAAVRTEPHYVLFDVEEDRMTGRAVNLEGNVFDTFVIGHHQPAAAP